LTELKQPNLPGFRIRWATEADSGLILSFIKKLAVYEKMEDQVAATEEKLRQSIFADKRAEVLIGEENGVPVGFALFFCNYSTFLGGAGMYLEDLFVDGDMRGKGYGKALFLCLAGIAADRGYERFDWTCLDWNTSSIDFYKSLGAAPLEDWTIYRLQGETLRNLVK
jgi:GNAT superfamily N-acetyltransferase